MIIKKLLAGILPMLAGALCAQSQVTIYHGARSTPTELAVCEDLREDLEKVTGAVVHIAQEPPKITGGGNYYLVGTPASSDLISRMADEKKIPSVGDGIIRTNGSLTLLAGITVEGMQNTVYDYCRTTLGIDPMYYWTGREPGKKKLADLRKTQHRVVPSQKVPIVCYFENDVDELANMSKPYLEYDMATWKAMVNSLRRTRYNAIHPFDMFGRPEFYTREPYRKLRPDYKVNLPLVDSMIDYAHLKGMKVQVDLSLGYQMRSISDSEALCWTQYKDKWIDTWIYYLTKTPLGKADIYSLRPRNQVWDRAYVSSCGENRVEIFNQVFAALDSVLAIYKPGALKICTCYDDGMDLFNQGFTPPKDFIVVWADDGYCNFDRMPVSTRGYPFGTYMHAGFWTNHTVHDPGPLLIDSIMTFMQRNYAADKYLKVNGQTFRPFLLNLEAFGEWATDPQNFDGEKFYRQWTNYYFGTKAAPNAVTSMKTLHEAHFGRTGYVRKLSDIKKLIGFLGDTPVETPHGSFTAKYEDLEAPGTAQRYAMVQAACKAAADGLPAGNDFYHDYIYLPALMYRQLLDLENTLLGMARLKQAYLSGGGKEKIATAVQLAGQAMQQMQAIDATCLEGDRNPKWKTWYDPAKRRPNNGFPTKGMIAHIQRHLQKLSAQ
ncbi:glycosyl hydrolase 115 family protein [Chitinophaga sp. GCM10012297]|uniref:Glycosyl hydrolase 115 family protein n=1 Tax=Chitinophaga chungangae TaxID=2821488 RepID=A0ABS3YFM8_9BACT|nr:glycosyl hydrolase 115 family protein [Chitinophaga chungangae]MBO9153471.1 glycosyl hydrolase 115 family protein [Chitinophaga chungangae]